MLTPRLTAISISCLLVLLLGCSKPNADVRPETRAKLRPEDNAAPLYAHALEVVWQAGNRFPTGNRIGGEKPQGAGLPPTWDEAAKLVIEASKKPGFDPTVLQGGTKPIGVGHLVNDMGKAAVLMQAYGYTALYNKDRATAYQSATTLGKMALHAGSYAVGAKPSQTLEEAALDVWWNTTVRLRDDRGTPNAARAWLDDFTEQVRNAPPPIVVDMLPPGKGGTNDGLVDRRITPPAEGRSFEKQHTKLCLAAVALKLLEYQTLNKGKLPSSLAPLGVPPIDPHANAPLHYSPNGGLFWVYSVGPDGKWDGGGMGKDIGFRTGNFPGKR